MINPYVNSIVAVFLKDLEGGLFLSNHLIAFKNIVRSIFIIKNFI